MWFAASFLSFSLSINPSSTVLPHVLHYCKEISCSCYFSNVPYGLLLILPCLPLSVAPRERAVVWWLISGTTWEASHKLFPAELEVANPSWDHLVQQEGPQQIHISVLICDPFPHCWVFVTWCCYSKYPLGSSHEQLAWLIWYCSQSVQILFIK